ncbi:MAG: hypothetical protein M1834_001960 [Cirrosporium novae-zelandiae]|nr:MAG: hypothetical protein M1834_001960 [Cirrosporium novae-zelandiae]
MSFPMSRKQSSSAESYHTHSHHHPKSSTGTGTSSGNAFGLPPPPPPPPNATQINFNGNSSVGNVIYQHIHDMASKRISTLDYLRKAHEGHIHYFNTLTLSSSTIALLPSHSAQRAPRITHSLFLLGLSLPTILDLNAASPLDYLKTLNALLVEFEAYTSLHHSTFQNSSGTSAVGERARQLASSAGTKLQLFKRAGSGSGPSGRRSSSAGTSIHNGINSSESNHPLSSMPESGGMTTSPSDIQTPNIPTSPPTNFPVGILADPTPLLPGESYTHLLTPTLPFALSFHEVFCTLCDVLIDTYTRLLQLVASPVLCTPVVGEVFAKADARVRKAVVSGVVREFEEVERKGVREEIKGVGKCVLGGLM